MHLLSTVRIAVIGLCLSLAGGAVTNGQLVLTGGGLSLVEEGGMIDLNNLASPTAKAVPFALDVVPGGPSIDNLTDGVFGTSSVWLGNGAASGSGPFVGLTLPEATEIRSFAFGRDNAGSAVDRAQGVYRLEFTNVPSPSAATPDTAWLPIGTLEYRSPGGDSLFTDMALRHRYNFDSVLATGIRLMVPRTGPATGTAIDELELYAEAIAPKPPLPTLDINASAGYLVTWQGDQGQFSSPLPGAGPPTNLASANQSFAFGSTDLSHVVGPMHRISNVNDGLYGNIHSWAPDLLPVDPAPFIALDFEGTISLTHLAWSRDNGLDDASGGDSPCVFGGCTDRALGTYTLQVTQRPNPGTYTPETGDSTTGWATIAEVDYLRSNEDFKAWLRHTFDVAATNGQPVLATGLRVKVSDARMTLDELEVYGSRLNTLVRGDVTLDGKVDLNDFGVLKSNFGFDGGRQQGDLDSDGDIDLSDFGVLKEGFRVRGSVSVPEPSTSVLAIVGMSVMLALVLYRQRGGK